MPLVDCFYKGPIKYYVNTHEQSGCHAATAYAKTTGKVGICIGTSGPGLTNMITPILDATNDSTPLIVFSGQVPLSAMGSNAFQECPAVEITKPITKWSYCLDNVDDTCSVIDEAFRVASTGKKGAVHIDLPKDVLCSESNSQNSKIFDNEKFTKYQIDIDKIIEVANVINKSKKPVLYIGQGAKECFKQIRDLSKIGNIPATTTIHGMGIIDEEDDLSLEMLGMHGSVAANYSIQNTDCLISIGTRFDDRTTGNLSKYAPEAIKAGKNGTGGIIHCNINPNEIDNIVKPDYSFNCTAEKFVECLLPHIKNKKRNFWINQVNSWKNNFPFTHQHADNNKIKTQDVITEINNYILKNNLSSNTIITSGVGNHQMMSAQFIKWKYPNKFATSGSLGVMGVGLPYAIGAQIGNPHSLVIDIDGDSSFNHTLSELKTLVEYNLPIKMFILNDHNQSMVRVWEELFFNSRYTATASEKNPKYHDLAESYGIESICCDNINDLDSCIELMMKHDGPILGNFIVETDKCFPLVAPGKGLDEMFLHEKHIDKKKLSNILPPS